LFFVCQEFPNSKQFAITLMAQGGKQVKPWSWDMESGGESVVAVVKELACEIGDSLRNGGKQSWVERTQDLVRAKGPRLNKAIGHASGNVMIWMNQGGFWRKLLVSSVGLVLLIALTGFIVFSLFLLIATANAVVVGLLMSASAVGAFTACFFTALTLIYVGVLTAAAFAIGTATVVCAGAVLFVTGWIAFAWVVWQGVKSSMHIAKNSLALTGEAISTMSGSAQPQVITLEEHTKY
jgi:hypothetical protein